MTDFLMPSLGADMTEGTLVEWLVRPGSVVRRGDLIATVDTAKSAIDVEVFIDGTVRELLVTPGSTVAVGAPLARIEPVGEHGSTRQHAPSPTVSAESTGPAAPRIAASPLARRRAREQGIDLTQVQTTSSVIRAADVKAPQPVAATQPRSKEHKHADIRSAIGSLMARSKREIPHYYLESTIDLQRAFVWLTQVNAALDVDARMVPAALLLKATAVALREVPDLNGWYREGAFTSAEHVDLGVAVGLRGGGLVAPVIPRAESLPLADVMAAMKALATAARAGRLRASQVADATITVTNLGERGAELVHGVITPPQVALVGFGRIVERPWAVDRMLAVRPVVRASLAADHRVSDGHRGSLLLAAIDDALQHPESL